MNKPVPMIGVVKWFNDAKGFGFITGPNGEEIFAHYSAIQCEGFKTLVEGQRVAFDMIDGPKAMQAFNIKRAADKFQCGNVIELSGEFFEVIGNSGDGRYILIEMENRVTKLKLISEVDAQANICTPV